MDRIESMGVFAKVVAKQSFSGAAGAAFVASGGEQACARA